MKKGFSILVASMMMCSVAFASPTANEQSFTGLSAMEHTTLFGDGSTVKVAALDSEEMEATEGEFFWFAIPFAYSYVSYLNAPTLNSPIYGGRVYRSLPRRR
jgi:hypothetical protein